MTIVSAYWRPDSTALALDLLERPGAIVLAGGTTLNERRADGPIEVVDLQALHLDAIEVIEEDALRIGAMATYDDIATSVDVPSVVRDGARHEQPSTLRAQATLGGCVAVGDRDSELLATLLVHDAVVHLTSRSTLEERSLAAVLAELPLRTGIIVLGVTIDRTGVAAIARAARTRADAPIVAAVVRAIDGTRRAALTGVARTPIIVESADVDPPGDFRGSPEYRRALAHTLLARATEAVA